MRIDLKIGNKRFINRFDLHACSPASGKWRSRSVHAVLRQATVAFTLPCALLMVSLLGCGKQAGNGAGARQDELTAEQLIITPVDYTPPPQGGYVGDAACADCHQDISDSFSSHPMARSIVPVEIDAEIRRMGGREAAVGPAHHHYVIQAEGEELWHRERMLDPDGEILFEQGKPVQYAVGSGQRAIAYLSHHNDLLFMSPLNWYSEANQYDFAPGHSVGDPRRFGRRAGEDCLSCHAGRVNQLERGGSRYGSPPFHQLAIGCENCHGPGEAHVRFQTGGVAADDVAATDPIINPADLDHQRREAVCYQCHLHATARVLRPERSQFDFRPGDRLDDVWAMLVHEQTITADGKSKAVNHVQQMHSSRCYRESDGRLGCISCHDPHGIPEASQRFAFYRNRCLACHSVDACSEEQPVRMAVEDSCTECHMPSRDTHGISHVSQTDHRIMRCADEPSTAPGGGRSGTASFTSPDSLPALKFLWDTAARLPDWEHQRTRGIALWLAGSHAGSRPPREIIQQLEPIVRQRPEDGTVQTVLGAYWMQLGSPARAQPFFEAALADPHARETAVSNLLTIYYLTSQWTSALQLSEQMLQIEPDSPRVHSLRADIFANLGQPEKAIDAAEVALRLDPTLVPVRQYLIGLYQRLGATEDATRHQHFLQRMRGTGRAR